MLLLREPTATEIEKFAASAGNASFNFQVGLLGNAAAGQPNHGWISDNAAAAIGHGPEDFAAARQAIIDLVPFAQPWLVTHAPNGLALDAVIGIQVRLGPIWSVNWSRVIELVDEPNTFSFVYATTTDHGEAGEERFAVSIADDGTVTYRITAISRPARPYTLAVVPYVRALQAKFRRGSIEAMKTAVAYTRA
jgi:uncharacterized protein (UPF0548 family)